MIVIAEIASLFQDIEPRSNSVLKQREEVREGPNVQAHIPGNSDQEELLTTYLKYRPHNIKTQDLIELYILISLIFISNCSLLPTQWPLSLIRALSPSTLNRLYESRLGHGCLSVFFCVLLSCVGTGLATS
jgi:hypothetical protein